MASIMDKKLQVRALQIVFFLEHINLSDKLFVASSFQKEFDSLFDDTPVILPVPDDAPQEIPRVTLSSKNKTYVCNIATNRVDLVHQMPGDMSPMVIEDTKKSINTLSLKLNKLLTKKLEASSYRTGLIMNLEVPDQDGGLKFMKKYILGKPEDNAIEVRLHKRYLQKLSSIEVNNWIRINSGNKAKSSDGQPPLRIISDINSVQDKTYRVNEKFTESFFKNAIELSLETVSKILEADKN